MPRPQMSWRSAEIHIYSHFTCELLRLNPNWNGQIHSVELTLIWRRLRIMVEVDAEMNCKWIKEIVTLATGFPLHRIRLQRDRRVLRDSTVPGKSKKLRPITVTIVN